MDLSMHIQIAEVLVDSLNHTSPASLSPFWFKLGAIMPDISPRHRVQVHHVIKSDKFVRHSIHRIDSKRIHNRRLSFLLGKISHLLSDTFCLMHNHESGKKPNVHMRYEKRLSRFFGSLRDSVCLKATTGSAYFGDAKDRCLIAYIQEKNAEYNAKNHTLTTEEHLINDISFLYFCCLNVLTEIINRQTKTEMPHRSTTKKAA